MGKILAGGYFFLVEIMFLKLGVYKQHWWKTIYTFIFTTFYFFVSDLWENMLRKNIPQIRFVSLFFMIMATEANLLFVFAVKRNYDLDWEDIIPGLNILLLIPLYAISLSLFATWSLLKKNSWTVNLRILIYNRINKAF